MVLRLGDTEVGVITLDGLPPKESAYPAPQRGSTVEGGIFDLGHRGVGSGRHGGQPAATQFSGDRIDVLWRFCGRRSWHRHWHGRGWCTRVPCSHSFPHENESPKSGPSFVPLPLVLVHGLVRERRGLVVVQGRQKCDLAHPSSPLLLPGVCERELKHVRRVWPANPVQQRSTWWSPRASSALTGSIDLASRRFF